MRPTLTPEQENILRDKSLSEDELDDKKSLIAKSKSENKETRSVLSDVQSCMPSRSCIQYLRKLYEQDYSNFDLLDNLDLMRTALQEPDICTPKCDIPKINRLEKFKLTNPGCGKSCLESRINQKALQIVEEIKVVQVNENDITRKTEIFEESYLNTNLDSSDKQNVIIYGEKMLQRETNLKPKMLSPDEIPLPFIEAKSDCKSSDSSIALTNKLKTPFRGLDIVAGRLTMSEGSVKHMQKHSDVSIQ